ncbi:uncharacterized protein LOC121052958 isoform X2 [Rosa chinensis]|uniref:uncharacterized protein LOC121052958 isoform X2 n=1 Tax=Rosa chinensis TaxID=74649 RepID=UPI001AD929FC|nr:uncharacterized protein LOC121052958 isoform X2 [Rosa chinensis]
MWILLMSYVPRFDVGTRNVPSELRVTFCGFRLEPCSTHQAFFFRISNLLRTPIKSLSGPKFDIGTHLLVFFSIPPFTSLFFFVFSSTVLSKIRSKHELLPEQICIRTELKTDLEMGRNFFKAIGRRDRPFVLGRRRFESLDPAIDVSTHKLVTLSFQKISPPGVEIWSRPQFEGEKLTSLLLICICHKEDTEIIADIEITGE